MAIGFGRCDPSLLKSCFLFEHFDDLQCAQIAEIAEGFVYAIDEMIYAEGSPGDSIFILLDGEVKVVIDQQTIDQSGVSGSTYGETGFLEKLPRSASLLALSETRMLRLDSALLWNLIQQNPVLGVKFLTQIACNAGKRLRKSAHKFAHHHGRKIPLSQYHRDPETVGKDIHGVVVGFDLKLSQLLRSQKNLACDPTELLNRAVFPFRLLLAEYKGIEFSFQGDGALVFFPDSICRIEKVVLELVPQFLRTRENVLMLLENDRLTPEKWHLNYRIAIMDGCLKPTVQIMKDEEKADWVEGAGEPLTEIARLLEIEKSIIDPAKVHTSLIVGKSTAEKIVHRNEQGQLHWHDWRSQTAFDKHQHEHAFFSKLIRTKKTA